MANDIKSKVIDIVFQNVDEEISSKGILLEDSLESLGIYSVGFIKIAVNLEREFGFEFDPEILDKDNFSTVGSIVSYVEDKLK